ncbi:MAG: TRCF domain-containing protein, partial [Verrucomicrobiota bacterium]
PQQNTQILNALRAGQIDIVIGTHRLISEDVAFKNLGLLIIDEEQRFGVVQKERLKAMRANVDILTLSATPIPRTLYLALAGAREMSVIETAPAERLPIQTVVKQYDPELVRTAIRRELERGGQVFYLHNRVGTIDKVASQIEEMMSGVRVAVGHGQMDEGMLERVMTNFVAGEYDVLVCTTIIESGLDIPNCNTLIIEGADRFGLSQLYQIRGRVGRFKRQAYAYLLLHKKSTLRDPARKRLASLRQYNQLGAGFRIAMRDLELRGAGNILGSQQSGHIAGVGFDLYCQLLRQSVARLKGDASAEQIRATVRLDFVVVGRGEGETAAAAGRGGFAVLKEEELSTERSDRIEAYIPESYMAESRLRIDTYRRLAMADTRARVDEIADSLTDRFGEPPRPVQTLLLMTEIRCLAEQKGINSVETEGSRLKLQRARPQGKNRYIQIGNRFPRLTQKKPFPRLKEVLKILQTKS